jgi:type VI secretion system protein ImpL
MRDLLKNRAVLAAFGLVLVALIIWFAGPYFAFADVRPLQSAVARLTFILVLVIAYAAFVQWRQFRRAQASEQLVAGAAKQGEASDGESGRAADAEATQLRRRFESAVDSLKRSRRKGLASLYELPWYIVIGPPGSGKTTVLVNSGLSFPLAQKFGKEALRGVGGTRNCDWWFTDEAVLLDTAGRYTTQDSDSRTDAAGWGAFLKLLCKYRRRQPINGVLVALSAQDLLTAGEGELERHAVAIRERLDELGRFIRIDVPVYLIVTKTDLVAGFTEFFDELGQAARGQVWGMTFPLAVTESGRATDAFGREFDALIERLQQRVPARLEGERDSHRRGAILAFPRQMTVLRPVLDSLLKRVFSTSEFDRKLLLRGIYLTSGTQEGTPIDRVLGAVARTLGVSASVAPPPGARGKSYFIESLLRKVIFQESGLAGANRKFQLQRIALQTAVYAAFGVVAILGLIALGVSYSANAAYVEDVGVAAKELSATRVAPGDFSADRILARLDSLRAVTGAAEKYEGDVPWRMRAGLYRGRSLGAAARDAYTREINGVLPALLSAQFAQQLSANVSNPDRLYEYLKGYLMLGDPGHRDPDYLRYLGRIEWQRIYPDDSTTSQRLSEHFEELLAGKNRLRSAPPDEELVEQARATLRSASIPALMYSRLKLSYAGEAKGALRLDLAAGTGAPLIFIRRSGLPLSEPLPSLYTRGAFREINATGKYDLIRQFAADAWVFGNDPIDLARSATLLGDVIALYEQDYIRAWDEILRDVTLKPTASARELGEVLAIASSPSSPFKGLLNVVASNTDLLREEPSAAGQIAKRVVDGRASQLVKILGGQTSSENRPGARVSGHFAPLRQLVTGGANGPAQIDAVLIALGDTQRRLQSIGSGLGDTNALDALTRSGEADALRSLQLVARQLPVPVGDMIGQIGLRSEAVAVTEARVDLGRRYNQQVLRECRDLIEGRYPLSRTSTVDVPLADFARVFGPGGAFDTFFRENLAPLVDTSRTPWNWRPGAAPIGGSASLLRQFQAVQQIRDVYFGRGGQTPEARFFLAPDFLDASVMRFTLDVDGQGFEYRHGPQQSRPMSWPGGAGQASFAFDAVSGPIPGMAKQGPWAWFRLLDLARVERESDVRYRVTFSAGGKEMRVILDAASSRNPFGRNGLAGFSCAM